MAAKSGENCLNLQLLQGGNSELAVSVLELSCSRGAPVKKDRSTRAVVLFLCDSRHYRLHFFSITITGLGSTKSKNTMAEYSTAGPLNSILLGNFYFWTHFWVYRQGAVR